MAVELISPDFIHISRRCRSSMDEREKQIVSAVFSSPSYNDVDLQSTARYLWEQGLLDQRHLEELTVSFRRRSYRILYERLAPSSADRSNRVNSEIFLESQRSTGCARQHEGLLESQCQSLWTIEYISKFVEVVCDNLRLEELIQALYFTGHANIAQDLFRKSLLGQNQGCVIVVKRLDTRNKQSIEVYFRFLKRVVHNGKLEEPFKWLRKLARELKVRMERERDPQKRQYYADKYVAHLGAEIDAMAITFDKTLPDAEIFRDLKCLSDESSKPLISDIVYFGRRANALAIAGKFDEGETMVTGAHCCANFAGPCLEIANMIYIDVYFKLWQFEHSPSQQIQRELIFAGNKGLWALSEEDEDTRNLWTRMFLLRMIFCLLGIGNKANIINSYSVPTENILEAGKLLDAIKLEGIETRREMFYWVAKARYYQLENEIKECYESIEKAENLAVKGHFKELFNIQSFASVIKSMCRIEITLPKEPETDLALRSAAELSNVNESSRKYNDIKIENKSGHMDEKVHEIPLEHEDKDGTETESDFENTVCKLSEITTGDIMSDIDETDVKILEDSPHHSLTYSAILDDYASRDTEDDYQTFAFSIEITKDDEKSEQSENIKLDSCEKLDLNSLQKD
ncbi:hypothetical protein FSP39_023478 [Pinctada imbricata]|uniref:Uncharacterized protein n=1 Tax=Pinctada imbricata TaxID=66713 RepID=A0AA88Y1X6_PINIB|nr:hypothetical protein FSP39_023478 [Pinctada imbricata]